MAAHLSRSCRIALARTQQVPAVMVRAGLIRLAATQPQAFAGSKLSEPNFNWQREATGSETSSKTQPTGETKLPPRLDFDRWVEGPVNYRPGVLSVIFLFFVTIWATRTAGMWEHTVLHPHRHYTGPNVYNDRCEIIGQRGSDLH